MKEWLLHKKKATEYMKSKKVKNMICIYAWEPYGIKFEEPISLSHILCIILYCDTNDLQNNMSSSFRKNKIF